MDRIKFIENLVVTVVLILILVKLGVGIYEQVNYVRVFCTLRDLLENPMIILRSGLLFDPIICVLALTGVFIRKPVGFVLILLLPAWVLFYRIIPVVSLNYQFAFLGVLLPIILFTFINLNIIRKRYQLASIFIQIKLNGIALTVGLSIVVLMYYFNGSLMWYIESILN